MLGGDLISANTRWSLSNFEPIVTRDGGRWRRGNAKDEWRARKCLFSVLVSCSLAFHVRFESPIRQRRGNLNMITKIKLYHLRLAMDEKITRSGRLS